MRIFERSFRVSLAQRYWNFEWDEATNRRAYGRLASRAGVGANLRVRVFSDVERDLQPGAAFAKSLLDHRALFADEPTFADRPSTQEALARWMVFELTDRFATIDTVEIVDDELGCAVRARTDAGTDTDALEFSERIGNLEITRRCEFDPVTGLGCVRDDRARRAVRRVAAAFAAPRVVARDVWAHDLRAALAAELPDLIDLRIDLGERELLRAKRAIKETAHAF